MELPPTVTQLRSFYGIFVAEGYVYFDLFNHNAASNIVRLVSPAIAANGETFCMTFWFAAFGAGEDGNLKILREDNTTAGNPNELVSLSGSSCRLG